MKPARLVVACFAMAGAARTSAAAAQSAAPELRLGREIICPSIYETGQFPQEIEGACLTRLSNFATRTGEVLRIVLENGTSKVFKDSPQSCQGSGDPKKSVFFTIRSYHPRKDAAVVERRIDGPTQFLLGAYMVERATGRVIDLPNEPRFAPGGSRFVSLSVCFDHCANRIDMWSIQDGVAKLEWRERIKQGEKTYFYELVGWQGPDEVKLRIYPQVEPDGSDAGRTVVEAEAVDAKLTRTGQGWKLESPFSR